MSVAEEIARRRAVLLDLAGAFGIDLGAKETADLMIGESSVPPDPQLWDPIQKDRLDGWFAQLGEALEEIRFEVQTPLGVKKEPPVVAKPASHSGAALDSLLTAARKYGSDVDIALTIKKKPFEQDLGVALAGEGAVRLDGLRIAVFFFGAALERILSRADAHYRFFEKHFLEAAGPASPDRLLLVLVADLQGQLRGPYLAILGADHLGEAAAFLAAAGSFETLSKARGLMKLECLWDQRAWLLAPDFFLLNQDAPGDLKACRRSLRQLQNQLSVPYLANWTAGDPGALEAKFEGNRTLRIDAEDSSAAPFDFYGWAYRDPEPVRSKLAIVRRVMASRLPSGTKTLKELVANIPDLLSECDVQLRLLMNENLAESFERRERIESLVRGYIDQVSQQIESLSKEVVDNAYKTVGLLVGVAIAYLLNPEGGTVILVLGLTLYIAYILFILFFYLRSLEQEQKARKDAFDLQKGELERFQMLTAESTERLQSVQAQDTKLNDKLRSVRGIYWTLVLAAIVLMLGWFAYKAFPEKPEAVRNRALAEQAERFKRFGYQDVRADAQGWPAPAPLVDGQGRAILPDMTAIRKSDRRFLVVSWAPCETIGKPAELQRLLEVHALADRQKAELQVLTEAVCAEETGPDKLRSSLRGNLPGLKIWTR